MIETEVLSDRHWRLLRSDDVPPRLYQAWASIMVRTGEEQSPSPVDSATVAEQSVDRAGAVEDTLEGKGEGRSPSDINSWLAVAGARITGDVEADVAVTFDDQNVNLWIVIPERDLALARKIIGECHSLLQWFDGGPEYSIDFHIIYRQGRDLADVLPSHHILLTLPA